MSGIALDRNPSGSDGLALAGEDDHLIQRRVPAGTTSRSLGPVTLAALMLAASPAMADTFLPDTTAIASAPGSAAVDDDTEKQHPAAVSDTSPLGLRRILAKAITFETLSSTGEAALFLAFYGGSGVGGASIFAISLTTATAVYVGHELAWEWASSDRVKRDDPQILAAKAATYRVASTVRSFTVGSLVGAAEIAKSAAFAASVAVADTALYVANDLVFFWLASGRESALMPSAPPGTQPNDGERHGWILGEGE